MFNRHAKICLFYSFNVMECYLYSLPDEFFVQCQIHEFLCIFLSEKIYILDYIENHGKNLVKTNLVLEYLACFDLLVGLGIDDFLDFH